MCQYYHQSRRLECGCYVFFPPLFPLNLMPCVDAVITAFSCPLLHSRPRGQKPWTKTDLGSLWWLSWPSLIGRESSQNQTPTDVCQLRCHDDCVSVCNKMIWQPVLGSEKKKFWAAANLESVCNMFRLVHLFQLPHRGSRNSSAAVHTV